MEASRVAADVVCPFCSLGCDDLRVAVAGAELRLLGPPCPTAAAGFAHPAAEEPPRVRGEPASLDAAVARAAELLRASALPLFAGLGTDVAGMRAVLALAERTGGVVDHAGSRGLLANVRAMQDGGNVTATLAELRNRADLVLLVGGDPAALAPRLAERCLAPKATLFGPIERHVVQLGPGPGLQGARRLACAAADLGEVLAVLRALAAGARVAAGRVAGLEVDALRELARRLRDARYPVVLWAARDLPGAHPDLVTSTIAGLIRELNAKGRCAGVPLVGPDDVVGVNQVCAWQSGVPLRASFASGAPDHDPARWSIAAVAAAADCLVWISSFGPQPLPDRHPRAIALVRPGDPVPNDAEVVVRIGTPGVDQPGSVYRMDGVVGLPLRALRATALPSAAEVLGRIRAVLEAP